MMTETKSPKARKLTPKQQAKADETRVAKRFTATFNCVQMDMFSLAPVMIAGKKARDEGADDDGIDRAMILAFRTWIPTPVPSIPKADLAKLGTAPDAPRVGEPEEAALAFCQRAGLRVLSHSHIGHVVAAGAAGERLVFGRDPETRKLYYVQNGVIEGRVLLPLAEPSSGAPPMSEAHPWALVPSGLTRKRATSHAPDREEDEATRNHPRPPRALAA
jgi:hypothetical protein